LAWAVHREIIDGGWADENSKNNPRSGSGVEHTGEQVLPSRESSVLGLAAESHAETCDYVSKSTENSKQTKNLNTAAQECWCALGRFHVNRVDSPNKPPPVPQRSRSL
jgi:hypothetical protein